jgi:cytochrome c peroxidase
MATRKLARAAATLIVGCAATGVQSTPPAAAYANSEHRPSMQELAALGRAIFFDASLSASHRTSCASCHDPAYAYGPPNGKAVQRAGADGRQPGTRAVPSLRYLQTLPPFSEHHFENDGDGSVDAGPTGGHTWDGRASSAHDQARLPLLSPLEMANASPADFVQRLRGASYVDEFRAAFGEGIFDDKDSAFGAALMALEVFQQTPAEFYPYSSKYDAVLRGQATLTPREQRGLALFNDPDKGNCASCHFSARGADGAFPLFTDFGHVALGVPRNSAIPANADARHFDLGLCGPLRTDYWQRTDYCGRFRAPTLRNTALRRSFFHNGVFRSLDQVLDFYAERDVHPERFYPRDAKGVVRKFDDLPAPYLANVNTDPPLDRTPSQPTRLTRTERQDIIAFLRTLTDADVVPGQR